MGRRETRNKLVNMLRVGSFVTNRGVEVDEEQRQTQHEPADIADHLRGGLSLGPRLYAFYDARLMSCDSL